MKRHERLSSVLELLAQRGRLDVEELAAEFDVSQATVRRDFDHLAEQQLLTRTRGGAATNNVSYDLPLRYKEARKAAEKDRIAKAAAQLVRRGSVVGLTGGTTATAVARFLATRPDLNGEDMAGGDPGLTVVTNALNIASELAVRPQIKIVVTGGVARPQSFELTGPLAGRILEEITLDLVFLGANAVDRYGVYAHHEGEASINRIMTDRAHEKVAIVDSSKLDRHAFAKICALADLDCLITDRGASEPVVNSLRAEGLSVRLV
ncbi:DeoR/GlpR family DNA-binding transcription regulator [Labedaea rhizosphaerae]|uniref:DeoR family transcriptional regulator n=1 Tax=Labedaea rhizosphaerae TaxID=598644 RepID=A0A4R6S5S0_LABRH|nr:DeoR/GlpR family DNA-binding transcription regulator [Labedaea rhizosphaerae]TDP95112.1 DeoR family transcriptional regulator [Labedaea rhizosphaerae]